MMSAVAGATSTRSASPHQADMPHLGFVGEGEELGIDLAAGQRGDRQGGHELRPALGQDHAELAAHARDRAG